MLLNFIPWPKIFIVKRWTQKSVIICHLSVLESLAGSRARELFTTKHSRGLARETPPASTNLFLFILSSLINSDKRAFSSLSSWKQLNRFRFFSCDYYCDDCVRNSKMDRIILNILILPDTANSLRLRIITEKPSLSLSSFEFRVCSLNVFFSAIALRNIVGFFVYL